jgi:hypothetical protein
MPEAVAGGSVVKKEEGMAGMRGKCGRTDHSSLLNPRQGEPVVQLQVKKKKKRFEKP